MRRWTKQMTAVALSVVTIAGVTTSSTSAGAATVDDAGVVATYRGQQIDLASDWQGATACAVVQRTVSCFDSEAEMDAAFGWDRVLVTDGGTSQVGTRGTESAAALADCATPVRLYSSTYMSGSSLAIADRGMYINLSSYGFDNVTSSYRIGTCWSAFYDGTGGGAPTYPGSTLAGASATSMVAGWDNRVSSVYIA